MKSLPWFIVMHCMKTLAWEGTLVTQYGLSPSDRQLARLDLAATYFDLVVVGGGVVGAGIAIDAANRGLRVALVEASDWASGASSKSTRLIHGGVRHLEMLDLALASDA